MTTIFRLSGANFAGQGLPNINPFISMADLEYAFDFRNRATKMTDLAGKHVITPKRVDQVGAVLNVTDPTIISTDASGLGINVELGYLQLDLTATTIATGGAKQFTFMVAGGWSGVAFNGAKVSGVTPTTVVLLDWGNVSSGNGFAIEQVGLLTTSAVQARIESPSASLNGIGALSPPYKKTVTFLTFDGTNWTLTSKTMGLSATGTNTSLSVSVNPIAVTGSSWAGGKVTLGGHTSQTTTVAGGIPTLFQQAMWNRVLTGPEIEEQYQKTKANFAAVGL